MKQINRYKGVFNWSGEVFILYSHATNEKSARGNMFTQLAKKLKQTRSSVSIYFIGTSRYKIYKEF